MRRTKQSIKRAVDVYIADVTQHFPGLVIESTFHPEMGVEAWLWVQIGANDVKLWDAVEAYTSELTLRVLDEQGLNIVAIPTTKKEPVHG